MIFPFRFMGLLALAFGAWILIYLIGHRPVDDRLSLGVALAGAAISIGFGVVAWLRPPDRAAR